ncbi:hypothetical protein [Spirosoma oryzicola]|uniref:hypothetical protein n=1 Tax=Spirosoma oryzicola TaxID=2898794 RepID=UPI001E620356|nr:hypothetical protein [Spirosoma oryzicola]UHG89866.1 hypothetical protein LQ777_16620 [Spirosoma oryzicola]
MNSENNYSPAEDDNQGVVQLLAQGEEANAGVSQIEYLSPITNQGPEPEKAEVNDSDVDANGVNDDLLMEEEVEDRDVNEEE